MLLDNKINAFQKTHSMLDDEPSETMSAAQLKAWWDSAPEELRVSLNGTIDAIIADYATKSELNGLVLGEVPDGSITEAKLAFNPATSLLNVINPATAVTNVYVDGAVGTDASGYGTGTGAAAYKTVAYAIAQLKKFNIGNININVAAGDYSSGQVRDFHGGRITLSGAANYATRFTSGLACSDCDAVTFQNIEFDWQFSCTNTKDLVLTNVRKILNGNSGLYVQNCRGRFTSVQVSNCVYNGATSSGDAVVIGDNSSIKMYDVSGTGNTVGLIVDASIVRKTLPFTLTGTTAQKLQNGGQVV